MSTKRGLRWLEKNKSETSVDAPSDEEPVSRSLVSVLVEEGVASESTLQQMTAEADAQGTGLGELVTARGLLDEEGMARLVARQWELPFLARGLLTMDPAAAGLLAFEQASTLGGCVIGIREGIPLVVVDDPGRERLDALRAQVETTSAGASVSFAVVTTSSLKGLLGQLARLNGRRPEPAPERSSLTRTTEPAAGKRAGQIASRSASGDQLLADLERAAATERTLLARLERMERERDAANQQIEQLQQQQLEAVDRERVSERDHDGELQARLDQLEGERAAAGQQVEELQREIEQLRQQLEAVDRERVSERDHGSQLQARLDQLESERDAADQQIEQLLQQIEQLLQQVEQLEQQLEAVDRERVSERDRDGELQARLDQLEGEREATGEQVEQLQQQLEAVEQERVSERDHGSQLQARLDQSESEREAAAQQIEQLLHEVEQLQQQLEAMGQERANDDEHESQLQAHSDAERKHLEHRDSELRRQIHELLTESDGSNGATSGEAAGEVPLIGVRLLEGVFSLDERRQLAKGLITAVAGVKGETFGNQTEVLIAEVPVANGYTSEGADTPH